MFSINERFRIVFKESDLSQEKFAEKIGRGRGEIANIIYDKTVVKDAIIKAVCKEFDISEDWLRHGLEPMYSPKSEEEEIAELVSSALDGSSRLKKAVIKMICSRSPEELRALEDMLRQLYESLEK